MFHPASKSPGVGPIRRPPPPPRTIQPDLRKVPTGKPVVTTKGVGMVGVVAFVAGVFSVLPFLVVAIESDVPPPSLEPQSTARADVRDGSRTVDDGHNGRAAVGDRSDGPGATLDAIVDEPETGGLGDMEAAQERRRKRYWTYGSAKSVVEQIDGPPTSVHKYPALGYEEWSYRSFATVKFGIPSGTVCEWNNSSGQLSVALTVGGKIAMPEPGASFGQGSSIDAVLRAQGTPRSIAAYPALGYVEWGYNAFDTIKFDMHTALVTEWDNYSGTLRVGAKSEAGESGLR